MLGFASDAVFSAGRQYIERHIPLYSIGYWITGAVVLLVCGFGASKKSVVGCRRCSLCWLPLCVRNWSRTPGIEEAFNMFAFPSRIALITFGGCCSLNTLN